MRIGGRDSVVASTRPAGRTDASTAPTIWPTRFTTILARATPTCSFFPDSGKNARQL